MRRILYASPLLALAFLVGNASAQTEITLRALDLNAGFISQTIDSEGVVVPAGVTGDVVVPPLLAPGNPAEETMFGDPVSTATHSFTVNQLDLVGDGVADDSVVFSYDVEAINGNISLVNNTVFAYDGDGTDDPEDNEMDPGEGLTFSNLGAVVTLGNPTGAVPALLSADFTFFQARFPGGGDVVELTDAAGNPITPLNPPDGGGNDPYNFAATPQTEFTVTAGTPADPAVVPNGFGVDTISATFVFESPTTNVLLGDVDLSGTVDFSDISPFIAVLSGGGFQAEADCDESGAVDFSDISAFITILSGS